MTRGPYQRRATVSEKVEQQHIVQLLRSLGATVYVLGTRRRKGDYQGTMQTPGIGDLYVVLPARPTPRPLWVEVKAKGGAVRSAQLEFAAHCEAMGHAYVRGGLDAVIAWLIAQGYLSSAQVPHYRVTP